MPQRTHKQNEKDNSWNRTRYVQIMYLTRRLMSRIYEEFLQTQWQQRTPDYKKKKQGKSDHIPLLFRTFPWLPTHLGWQFKSLPRPTGAAWPGPTTDPPGLPHPTVPTTHSTRLHTPSPCPPRAVSTVPSHGPGTCCSLYWDALFPEIYTVQLFTQTSPSLFILFNSATPTPPNAQQMPFLLIFLHSALSPLRRYIFWLFVPGISDFMDPYAYEVMNSTYVIHCPIFKI